MQGDSLNVTISATDIGFNQSSSVLSDFKLLYIPLVEERDTLENWGSNSYYNFSKYRSSVRFTDI